MIYIVDDRLPEDYISLPVMGYKKAKEFIKYQEERIDGVYVYADGGTISAKYLLDGHLCVISMHVDMPGLGTSMLCALFDYVRTKGQDFIRVRGIDHPVKKDNVIVYDTMDGLRRFFHKTTMPAEPLKIAVIDWKWAHYDIDPDTYQELIDSVDDYEYRDSPNDRYGWAMDRASEEAVTRAHHWLSGYRKNIYTTEDLTRNPHIKLDLHLSSGDDIEKFIQGLENKSKWVPIKEHLHWWQYPTPSPQGDHVGIFMYTSDNQLVASISASYSTDTRTHVNFVNTRLDYRNQGLCKIMFSTLAQYLSSTGRTTTLTLENAAGVAGCKCYTEGALQGGFTSQTNPATCGIVKNIALPFRSIPTTKSSREAIDDMKSSNHSHVVPTYRSKVLDTNDSLILPDGHLWETYQQSKKRSRE